MKKYPFLSLIALAVINTASMRGADSGKAKKSNAQSTKLLEQTQPQLAQFSIQEDDNGTTKANERVIVFAQHCFPGLSLTQDQVSSLSRLSDHSLATYFLRLKLNAEKKQNADQKQ